MTGARVLRVYHSGVVEEYRERDRLLRSRHGYDLQLVCPPAWMEGGSIVEVGPEPEVPLRVVEVRGQQRPILFWYASRQFRRVLQSEFRPQIVDLHEEPYSLAAASALRAVTAEVPGRESVPLQRAEHCEALPAAVPGAGTAGGPGRRGISRSTEAGRSCAERASAVPSMSSRWA